MNRLPLLTYEEFESVLCGLRLLEKVIERGDGLPSDIASEYFSKDSDEIPTCTEIDELVEKINIDSEVVS